ncbi:MAG: hypothetical protein RL468_2742, partial [Pseudomonadota bacterium]
ASGVDGLDFAPSVGVHQYLTIEFKGAWQLSGFQGSPRFQCNK